MTALFEQKSLACLVFFKARMLVRSDMIRLKIGKNTYFKNKALGSVELESLGCHFHDYNLYACIHHPPEGFLQNEGFRRGVFGRNMGIPYDRFDRSDQSHFISCTLQNRFDQISTRRLTLGSRDADDLQLVCRVPEICCSDKCHGISSILHPDHGYITVLWYLCVLLHDQYRNAFLKSLWYIAVSVCIVSADTDEQTSFFYLSGVVYNLIYTFVHIAPDTLIRQSCQQVSAAILFFRHFHSPFLPAILIIK